jgi:anti-sigma B factor antagonist
MHISNNDNLDMETYLINLSGPLNERQYEPLTEMFRDILAEGITQVVINLEDVPLIDSRGLAALVAGYKLFGRDPKNFRLVALQDQPKLVFELTGFDNVFEIFDDPTGATAPELERWLELPGNLPASETSRVPFELAIN